MIIGIDGNEANQEKRVGVNQYAYELLKSFKKLQDEDECDHTFVIFLKEEPRKILPKEGPKWHYKVLKGSGMWILKTLVPYLYKSRDELDVFFSPSHYVPPIAPCPRVCAIMDLGYLESSEQFRKRDYWQLKWWSAWSMIVSDIVIAISEATKNDIVKNYPFTSKKVRVTPLAGDTSLLNAKITQTDINRVKKIYPIGDNYILYLGTLKPSKNVLGLIQAWARVQDRFSVKLVIAGKKGWMYESFFDEVKSLKIEDRVVFTDFVADEDKAPLMKGAKVFVLPSFWEGFGIDVLNAMALGIPVITSSRGSLPEVAGKAGIYVNPENTVEIAREIEKVLLMPSKDYNILVERSKETSAKFSWAKTAAATIKVFESIKN